MLNANLLGCLLIKSEPIVNNFKNIIKMSEKFAWTEAFGTARLAQWSHILVKVSATF